MIDVGEVTTLAGNGSSSRGYVEGTGRSAQLNEPYGIVSCDNGAYFTDTGAHCIRFVGRNGLN